MVVSRFVALRRGALLRETDKADEVLRSGVGVVSEEDKVGSEAAVRCVDRNDGRVLHRRRCGSFGRVRFLHSCAVTSCDNDGLVVCILDVERAANA